MFGQKNLLFGGLSFQRAKLAMDIREGEAGIGENPVDIRMSGRIKQEQKT